MKEALKNDRARIQVGRISQLRPDGDEPPAAAHRRARSLHQGLPALRRHRPDADRVVGRPQALRMIEDEAARGRGDRVCLRAGPKRPSTSSTRSAPSWPTSRRATACRSRCWSTTASKAPAWRWKARVRARSCRSASSPRPRSSTTRAGGRRGGDRRGVRRGRDENEERESAKSAASAAKARTATAAAAAAAAAVAAIAAVRVSPAKAKPARASAPKAPTSMSMRGRGSAAAGRGRAEGGEAPRRRRRGRQRGRAAQAARSSRWSPPGWPRPRPP
jgi:hypothetical protein